MFCCLVAFVFLLLLLLFLSAQLLQRNLPLLFTSHWAGVVNPFLSSLSRSSSLCLFVHMYHLHRFMIGLGNPLVGPSAVDAVVAGCVYINPIYDQPMKEMYWSQHPFLEKEVLALHYF